MFRSADLVIEYLEKVDPEDAKKAKQRYGTLSPFRDNEFKYAEAVMMKLSPSREKEVVAMLVEMLNKGKKYLDNYGWIDGEELLFAQMNAKLVKDAEEYYRNAYARGPTTWNLRDKHMFETLQNLLDYHEEKLKKESRAVVWAHNSHIGDSRATEYARESGEWNIGQLVRQNIGKDKSFNVGFTSYTGTVTAATSWGGDAIKFKLNPALEDSCEAVFHRAEPRNWLALLRSNNPQLIPDEELNKLLMATRTERMVGVQYVKRTERQSHYVPATIPQQFDTVIHLDVTSALQPLDKPWIEEP
jgi:erythromycin esterase-like protein